MDRLLTVDLHADQIQGFFDIPVDNVYASPVLLGDAWKQKYENMIVVSPDVGGVVRARALAKRLDDADLAIIDKRRPRPNESKVMNIIGEVEGKTCVLIDDMVDTAGTLCQAAQALKDEGALKVVAYITHPVLSGEAIERISKSVLDELVVTDTIPLSDERKGLQADPPAERGGTAGGDHPAHQRRGIGEFAVYRLNWSVPAQLVAMRGRCVCDVTGEDYENLFRTRCRVPRDARQRCEPPPASRRKSPGNSVWRARGRAHADLEPPEAFDHARQRALLFDHPQFEGGR